MDCRASTPCITPGPRFLEEEENTFALLPNPASGRVIQSCKGGIKALRKVLTYVCVCFEMKYTYRKMHSLKFQVHKCQCL